MHNSAALAIALRLAERLVPAPAAPADPVGPVALEALPVAEAVAAASQVVAIIRCPVTAKPPLTKMVPATSRSNPLDPTTLAWVTTRALISCCSSLA